jgi:hypothetical protein
VYADPLLLLPNYAVTAFSERPDRHSAEPGFTAVFAYADGHPVGYAYGNTIEHGDRYLQRISPASPEKYTEHPAEAKPLNNNSHCPVSRTSLPRLFRDVAHSPAVQGTGGGH